MNDNDRIRAAIRAENELALTEAAFDGLKIAMVNALIDSDFAEGQQRESLYHALRILADVRKTLTDTVKLGSSAKAIAAHAEQFVQGLKA